MKLYLMLILCLLAMSHIAWNENDGLKEECLSASIDNPQQLEIGQPIFIKLAFRNTCKDSIYVRMTPNFGPDDISVFLSRSTCTYVSGPAYFDRSTDDLRFDYFPLRSNDLFQRQFGPINDVRLRLNPVLLVPEPGSYSLWVTFASKGPISEGTVWPIWRGTVKSNLVRVAFQTPTQSHLKENRDRLVKCLEDDLCSEDESIQYFRLVRDKEAAKIIEKILVKDHPPIPLVVSLVQALLNQKRPGDIPMIKKTTENPDIDPESKKFILGLIDLFQSNKWCEFSNGTP